MPALRRPRPLAQSGSGGPFCGDRHAGVAAPMDVLLGLPWNRPPVQTLATEARRPVTGWLAALALGLTLGGLFAGAKVREEVARRNYAGARAAVKITRPIWWSALVRYICVAVFVVAVLAACIYLYVTREPS
jgi:hypothetical protein